MQYTHSGLLLAVIYSLTEIETEKEIISLTETKRETEIFSKTETKYKWKSERTKLNSNWNENDFKTKIVTYNVKKEAFQSFDLFFFRDIIRLQQ